MCHCMCYDSDYWPLGDAYFYNLSVRENLDAIRSVLGVCPQHDILWGDLTAREHMLLFGILKDIPRDQLEEEIERLLENVNLSKVSHSLSLSLALCKQLNVWCQFNIRTYVRILVWVCVSVTVHVCDTYLWGYGLYMITYWGHTIEHRAGAKCIALPL